VTEARTSPPPFGALAIPGFRPFLATLFLTMLADNVEHVVSYWIMHQRFHSSALGGFAVIAHWLPYLVLSVPIGTLNDRLDSRRLIQIGGFIFLCVSLGWMYFFKTGTLEMWHAMVLLALHGCAGVFWLTSSQVLLYDIVGQTSVESAVRLSATTRYLGMLVGPGVGSLILRTLGATHGMALNAALYLPILLWLVRAPYGMHFRKEQVAKRPLRSLADLVASLAEVRKIPVLVTMTLLAGSASFLVGNSYQAQMPTFATDLGHGDPGTAYTALLGADAGGALLGGILLESGIRIFRTQARSAVILAGLWAVTLGVFARTTHYVLALALLFLAGFLELSFSSMAQAVVQLRAPSEIRGRVLGLYSMSAAGLRTFSGFTVGVLGSLGSVHTSLAVAAGAFCIAAVTLFFRTASSDVT
jgi:MFS family permease